MVNAQEWLDKWYPKEGKCVRKNDKDNLSKTRSEITNLNISYKNLQGALDLSGFNNLERLNCSKNQLTSLDLKDCEKLKHLWCNNNKLTNLILPIKSNLKLLSCHDNFLTNLNWNFLNGKKITKLYLENNNFLKQDLGCLSRFTNLESLRMGTDNQSKINQGIYNRWTGSLEYLQDMSKLKYLDISNTDLNSGIEYLPDSLWISLFGWKKISYFTLDRPKSKVREIKKELDLLTSPNNSDNSEYRNWIRLNFTWQEIKSWLDIGLSNHDYKVANRWKQLRLNTQQVNEWREKIGLETNDYEIVRKWKELEFNFQQTKKWIKTGGLTIHDHLLAKYLVYKNCKPIHDLNIPQLRKEYEENKFNAQFWLYKNYPQEIRLEIKQINFTGKELTGSLNLSDFPNLEIIDCSYNDLTELNISNCTKLKKLDVSHNTNINLKLEELPTSLEKFICKETKIQKEFKKYENKFNYSILLQRLKKSNIYLITKYYLEKFQNWLYFLKSEKFRLIVTNFVFLSFLYYWLATTSDNLNKLKESSEHEFTSENNQLESLEDQLKQLQELKQENSELREKFILINQQIEQLNNKLIYWQQSFIAILAIFIISLPIYYFSYLKPQKIKRERQLKENRNYSKQILESYIKEKEEQITNEKNEKKLLELREELKNLEEEYKTFEVRVEINSNLLRVKTI